MKKTILSFITVMLIITTLVFVGCKDDKEFYKKTATTASELYQTEEYSFLFNEDVSLDYGENINDQILNQESDYAILSNFYEPSLKNFTYMFSNLHVNLDFPKNKTDNVKKAYKTLDTNISKLKKSVNTFLQQKEKFVNLVEDNPTTESSKSNLKQFKIEYKKLLYTAEEFYQAFKSVYTKGFLSYPNMKTTEVSTGMQHLISSIAVGKLTSINLEYMFDDGNLIEHKNNSIQLLTYALSIKQSSLNPSKEEADILIEDLKFFLQVESTYNTEISQYKQALKNFSFTQYYLADNYENFLKKDDNNLYFAKINAFINDYSLVYTNTLKTTLL